ncbi:MAG: c-type cytochrome [Gammaproteobacteria bacterium]
MFNTKINIILISALVFFAAQNVIADEALAKSSNCLACHSVDNKIIGPAFKDISAKYKGDDGAVVALSSKVKNGGAGVWGDMQMPPNAAVSDADIETLVNWILSL